MRSSVRSDWRCSSVRSDGRGYGREVSLRYVRPFRWMNGLDNNKLSPGPWLSKVMVVRAERDAVPLADDTDSALRAEKFICGRLLG